MQKKSSQELFEVVVVTRVGDLKTVKVRASTLKVARRRALKRTPESIRIYRGERNR